MEVNQKEKDEIMEEDIEIKNLLEILAQTYSSTSTHKIKEAEEKLKQFDYVIINKLNKIFNLFALNKIPLPSQKALSIRIKYIFISLGKTKNLKLNDLLQYIELLINNLIDSKYIKQINISIIEQICEAFKKLINNKLFKGQEELLIKLSQSIIGKINSKNSFIIFSILYLIVLSPNININNINGIINDNFIEAIKRYIMGKLDINLTIKIIDLLSLSLKKILYLGQAKYMITNIINNLFENLFRILLDYCTDENSFVSFVNNYLIGDEEYIKQKSKENLLKSKIFLAIGFMIECDKSINNDNSIQDKKLEEGLIKIIKIILHSFDHIIKEELNNIEENYKNTNYEIIIYQAFSLLIKCISSSPFQKEFYGLAKNFVFFTIFPFFTLNLGENELFKESPDEYYLQVIDVMTDYNFKKIKTICGKCLNLICENYPDLSFVILNTIFELLIFFMEEYDLDECNLQKYTLIQNKIGKFFINNYTNESIINSCLLCISILAKQALINPELKASLHKFLLINQMRLENVASDKIQFKLCLLYGLFLDKLFIINNKEDKDFIKTAINFLLSIILYSDKVNEKNGLSYQSFHSLEQILENNDLKEITNELVKSYFAKQIIESIPSCNLIIYLDMVNLFIEKLEVFQENILTITNNILIKIKNDLINMKQRNNIEGLYSCFILKEMNIIGNIINIFDNPELENIICQFIINFIKENGDKNEFIESIINIIVNFTKKKNKSDLVKNLINSTDKIIIGYFRDTFYIDLPIFKLINYLIINNSKSNINLLYLLKEVIYNSLLKIDNFYGQENIIYTLLLIICWIIIPVQNENNLILNQNNDTEEMVTNIISIIINKLDKLIENNKIELDLDNQFLSYLYLVVIFSSFIYHSNSSFGLIYNKNYFNSLLNYANNIIIVNKVYFSLKLNKLMIFGLSKILYESDFLKLILVNFKDAFILNYNLISKQLAEETKESKMKNSIKEIDNDENDNINENNYLAKKLNDIINNNFIFPKLEFDEFDIFNTLYKKLIEINETKIYLEKIFEEMGELEKKDFKNILLTKKINIMKDNPDDIFDENTAETVHRRFVKIKHK